MATYEQTGGRGEDVTKISSVSSVIPRLGASKSMDSSDGESKIVDINMSGMQMPEMPARELSFN